MKSYLCLFILLALSTLVFSQNYDLIVKNSGDSVACRIDSIAKSHIYFEMRFNGKWTHTYILQTDIREYQYGAIEKKNIHFEPGSSYIQPGMGSHEEIGKNAIYGTLGIFGVWAVINANYERMIYHNKTRTINSIWFRVGGGAWSSWDVSGPHAVTGFTLLTGKGKSHIEAKPDLLFCTIGWDTRVVVAMQFT